MDARPVGLVLLVLVAGVCLAGFTTADGTQTSDNLTVNTTDQTEDAVPTWRTYEANDTLALNTGDGLSDAELASVVNRSMARVEELRKIRFDERPNVTVMDRAEFEERNTRRTLSNESAQFLSVKWQALFFIAEGEDPLDTQQDNRNASVGGYYSPATDEIVIVSDGEAVELDELTLAHELVHAWQDQAIGLGSVMQADTRDMTQARLGLIEGDAVFLESLYADRCETDWECLIPDDSESSQNDLNWGLYLADIYPYSDGPALIQYVYETDGWSGVDTLYEHPPNSTIQISDPKRYYEFEPREINLTDTNDAEWERLRPTGDTDHQRIGQAALTAMFAQTIYIDPPGGPIGPAEFWNFEDDEPVPRINPLEYNISYTSGWEGDRLHAYQAGEEHAYVWQLVWASTEDAQTFTEGYKELLRHWGGLPLQSNIYHLEGPGADGVYVVSQQNDTVTIVQGPTIGDVSNISSSVAADVGLNESTVPDDQMDPTPGFGVTGTVLGLLTMVVFVYRYRVRNSQ